MENIKTSVFLMFSGDNYGKANEAIEFYMRVFKRSKIESIRYKNETTIVEESHFSIFEQKYMAFDSEINHEFNFTPSISMFITLKDEEMLEDIYNSLSEGGDKLMPIDNYGFSKKFGWVQDKYGVTWQLNLN